MALHVPPLQAAQQRHCDQCWKSKSLLHTCPWKLEAPSKCFFLHLCVTIWYLSPGSGSPKETSQSPCLGLAGLPNVQKSSRGYRVKQSQAVNPQAVGSAAQQAVALRAQDTDAETVRENFCVPITLISNRISQAKSLCRTPPITWLLTAFLLSVLLKPSVTL